MAPEEPDSKGFEAQEENDPKTWMRGDSCYKASETTQKTLETSTRQKTFWE